MNGRPSWGLRSGGADDILVRGEALHDITPEWAWGGSTGRGVRVCVIDNGIEAGHPLVGPIAASYVVVQHPDGPRVEPAEDGDVCGHGTACAGIVRSIAPECEMISLRVLGQSFSGNGEMLLCGLRWAVDQGFEVLNLSLSTTRHAFLEELHGLADRAYFQRSVMVASAHNSPVESYPWRFSSVISVGSHHIEDPDLLLYNPEPPVEFFTLGQNVTVAWLDAGRRITTGNSFATPRVTGLVARILAKHPGLTPFQVKSVLYLASANVHTSPPLSHPTPLDDPRNRGAS